MTITIKREKLLYAFLLIFLFVGLVFLEGARYMVEKAIDGEIPSILPAEETHPDILLPEPRVIVSVDPVQIEAEYVAKVLYGTCSTFSSDARKAVTWVIINRVEDSRYPNTIKEVCEQTQQWMGYSEDNLVIQEFYDDAYEVLTQWHNGGYRMFDPNFTFLTWTRNEIVLRTTFNETPSTKYWKVN